MGFLDKIGPAPDNRIPMASSDLHRKLNAEVEDRVREYLEGLRAELTRAHEEASRMLAGALAKFAGPLPEMVSAESVPEPAAAAPAPVSAAAPEAGRADLRKAIRSIDEATNQVEVLRAFLSVCRESADRVLLLVQKGDALAVWKAEGFDTSAEAFLRSTTLTPSSDPAVEAAMAGHPLLLPARARISRALAAGDARAGVLIPIVVREKTSALLYADSAGGAHGLDHENLALYCAIVGYAIDRLATRKLSLTPALQPFESWEGTGESTSPAAEELPAPAPASLGTAPEIAPAEIAPPPQKRKIDPSESTGGAYRPPAGVSSGGASRILRGPLASADDDPHEEARRIARLLVSDIRLYNEASLDEGRKHGDIYERLREDIERARQTYNERVPDSLRQSTNYFHEELVRSLADGRPEILGI